MLVARVNPDSFPAPWQGSLWDLTRMVTAIRRSRAFGRLTLRNSDRLGVAHLYFHGGRLAHIVGSSGHADATLQDMQGWTHATLRFERGATASGTTISDEQELAFDRLLLHFQELGLSARATAARVVEGDLVSTTQGEQMLTPHEWRLLVESTRRVSQAMAQLIGSREALKVLRDILDDCSAAFPACAMLQIAGSGSLKISETARYDRLPRQELLEGFHALFATCQYFCVPLVGEVEAHRLMIRALGQLCPALISLGIFQVNTQLLARDQP